jgi:hypothetical protein
MRVLHSGALLILVAVSGCATWHPQGLTPRAVIERNHPQQVRVVRRDSTRVELRTPHIRGDSIQGETKDGVTTIALADVSYVSLRGGNKAGVAALTGVGIAAGLAALLAATWN